MSIMTSITIMPRVTAAGRVVRYVAASVGCWRVLRSQMNCDVNVSNAFGQMQLSTTISYTCKTTLNSKRRPPIRICYHLFLDLREVLLIWNPTRNSPRCRVFAFSAFPIRALNIISKYNNGNTTSKAFVCYLRR